MFITPGKLKGLQRLADRQGRFKMTAVDQRPPIMNLIKEKKGVSQASYHDVAEIKTLFTEVLAPEASAMLLDPIWAFPQAHMYVDPKQGLIVTLEAHEFTEDAKGRRSSNIADWSVAKIKAMGGDAVKALAWYRPDADVETCRFQQQYVQDIGDACRKYDIPFVFELLVYALPGDADQTKEYTEHLSKHPQNVVDSLKTFADPKYGVDLFKLESPIPASKLPKYGSLEAKEAQAWFDQLGQYSPVPWVMLSAGADMEQFYNVMHYAYQSGAAGYLAGRAIWLSPVQLYPDLSAVKQALQQESIPYMRRLNKLTDELATPWQQHRCYKEGVQVTGADENFPKNYQVEF